MKRLLRRDPYKSTNRLDVVFCGRCSKKGRAFKNPAANDPAAPASASSFACSAAISGDVSNAACNGNHMKSFCRHQPYPNILCRHEGCCVLSWQLYIGPIACLLCLQASSSSHSCVPNSKCYILVSTAWPGRELTYRPSKHQTLEPRALQPLNMAPGSIWNPRIGSIQNRQAKECT